MSAAYSTAIGLGIFDVAPPLTLVSLNGHYFDSTTYQAKPLDSQIRWTPVPPMVWQWFSFRVLKKSEDELYLNYLN